MAAAQADAQVDPRVAGPQAVLAARDAVGTWHRDLVEVGACRLHRRRTYTAPAWGFGPCAAGHHPTKDALTLETESPEVPAHPDEPSEVENPPDTERPPQPDRPPEPTGPEPAEAPEVPAGEPEVEPGESETEVE